MISFERQQRLVAILRQEPGIKVSDLAVRLGVSQGTVRNDLDALERAGKLSRVRGGAVLRDETQFVSPSFAERALVNAEKKQRIARVAATLVEDGDSILIDASTTVFAMIPFLKNRRSLTILTNSLSVGMALSQNPMHTVILIGGIIRPGGDSVTGPLSEQVLRSLHVKTAFVSCSGISIKAGLTEIDIREVDVKRQMIRCADRVVALVDASKFGKVDLSSFASLNQISHLFTDSEIPPDFAEYFKSACIPVTVCGEEAISSQIPCEEEDEIPSGASTMEVTQD